MLKETSFVNSIMFDPISAQKSTFCRIRPEIFRDSLAAPFQLRPELVEQASREGSKKETPTWRMPSEKPTGTWMSLMWTMAINGALI